MSFADICAVLSLEITKSKNPLQVIPSKNSPLSPKRKEGCFIKHVVEKNIPPCVKRRTGEYSIGRVMSEKVCKILLRPSPQAWGTPSLRGICDIDSYLLLSGKLQNGRKIQSETL